MLVTAAQEIGYDTNILVVRIKTNEASQHQNFSLQPNPVKSGILQKKMLKGTVSSDKSGSY